MKYSLNRRQFLATASLLPAIKFPSDVRHRLAVSTYPFRGVMTSTRKPAGAGKMTLQQFAATQDYNARSLAALFPHAYNISHVKDVEFSDGKPYRVDLDRIFAIAKKTHYRGYFSIESESEGDPYESTKLLIAAAARNLSAR